MKATDLSRSIWNALGDLARRSQTPREMYFSEVVKSDSDNNLIWVRDFGDVPIPLVAFERSFAYYDTVPTGITGSIVNVQVQRREDTTHSNRNFKARVICPSKGDLVVILDPFGARRFPMCIGLLLGSKQAWAES